MINWLFFLSSAVEVQFLTCVTVWPDNMDFMTVSQFSCGFHCERMTTNCQHAPDLMLKKSPPFGGQKWNVPGSLPFWTLWCIPSLKRKSYSWTSDFRINNVFITWTKRLAVYNLIRTQFLRLSVFTSVDDARLVDCLCCIEHGVHCYNSSCSSFILKLCRRDHRPDRLPTNKEVYFCLYRQRRIIRNNWTTF